MCYFSTTSSALADSSRSVDLDGSMAEQPRGVGLQRQAVLNNLSEGTSIDLCGNFVPL